MHNGETVHFCFSAYFLPGNNEIIWMKFEIWELHFRIYTVKLIFVCWVQYDQHFVHSSQRVCKGFLKIAYCSQEFARGIECA